MSADDRGIHAVLLYGARGSGKGELSQILSELWLCNSPTEEGADGTCRSCMAYKRGNSPDLLIIEPQGASSIISVKAITNESPKPEDPPTPLLTFFRTPPLLSRHKVAIIQDAHRMNGASANALLKTLEEPHPHAKIILTTDTVGNILPTILSRCLSVACEAPGDQVLSQAFPDATPDEVRFAEGTPGRLKTVTERRELFARLANFARRLLTRAPAEALVASEEFQSIAAGFQAASEGGVRSANTEALDALAIFYRSEPTVPPDWPHKIIEAHRRIVGNGGGGIVLDALFAGLLTR